MLGIGGFPQSKQSIWQLRYLIRPEFFRKSDIWSFWKCWILCLHINKDNLQCFIWKIFLSSNKDWSMQCCFGVSVVSMRMLPVHVNTALLQLPLGSAYTTCTSLPPSDRGICLHLLISSNLQPFQSCSLNLFSLLWCFKSDKDLWI